jgi:hypothetical protein
VPTATVSSSPRAGAGFFLKARMAAAAIPASRPATKEPIAIPTTDLAGRPWFPTDVELLLPGVWIVFSDCVELEEGLERESDVFDVGLDGIGPFDDPADEFPPWLELVKAVTVIVVEAIVTVALIGQSLDRLVTVVGGRAIVSVTVDTAPGFGVLLAEELVHVVVVALAQLATMTMTKRRKCIGA